VERVKRISRTLVYLLFIVVVVYLLSLRAERGKTKVLGQWSLVPVVQEAAGQVVLKERSDGSQVLVVKLKRAFPKTMVLVGTEEGILREIGELEGATFVTTLPKGLKARKITMVKLVNARTGRVLAEVSFKVK